MQLGGRASRPSSLGHCTTGEDARPPFNFALGVLDLPRSSGALLRRAGEGARLLRVLS